MAQVADPEGLLEPVEQQAQEQQDPEGLLESTTQAPQQAAQDPEGLLEPAEEKPSRLGAVGRAVAEEFIPTTVAGLAVKGISALPIPTVPKFLLGATGAILSYGAAGRLQEEAAKKIAGERAVEEFKAQRQRDIEAYPVSTFVASAATPTAGGIAALGRKGLTAAGQVVRGAFTKAETAIPQAVENIVPEVVGKVSPNIEAKTFYHGSPSTNIKEFNEDARGLVFVSEAKEVALPYRASRIKDVNLTAAGLTAEEKIAYNKYKKAIAENPDVSPDQVLASKDYDIASIAYEKVDAYKKLSAEKGRVYELNIPAQKIIDWRDKDNFYKSLEAVRADLLSSGAKTIEQKSLLGIIGNSINNKIPPQSGLLSKPFFDSLKKQGVQGITLPHSVEGSETMLIKSTLDRPINNLFKKEMEARSELLPKPGPRQRVSQLAERLITDPKTSENIARKFADERALTNSISPEKIARDLRELTPQQISAIAQVDDNTGYVARTVMMEDARLSGDIQTADMMFDGLIKKIGGAGQLLNIAKLIKTTPDGYSYIIQKTIAERARQFATKEERELAKSTKQFTPELRQQAIDLFTKNKIAAKARDDAFALARTDFSKGAKESARTALGKALDASLELSLFESKLLAKELGQQIPDFIRGNLLTTISQTSNILGNTVNMPTRAATRQVASLLDQIERNIIRPVATRIPGIKGVAEKYLAKDKQFASPLGLGTLERFLEVQKGGGRGFVDALKGLKTGISPESSLAGESIRGFRPITAMKQLFTGKGLAQPTAEGAGAVAAKTMDKIRLLSESTIGIPPEVMFRLLQLGDTPARKMALARRLSEEAQLRGLKGVALRRAVEFPSQAEVDKVAQEVSEAVYQQDSALSRGINYLLNMAPNALTKVPVVGKPLAGVVRTGVTAVIPYSKTPLNVIDEILEYSIPEYSFIKGLKNQATGNYRRAKMQFAKSIVGYAIGNVADIISNAGLITDKVSKSPKVRDVQYQGEPPKMINITGLQRYLESGGDEQEMQPGDYLVGLEKMGVVGAIMSTRNEARKARDSGDGSIGEAWGATLPATLSFGFNQSFLRNMNSLLGAVSRGEQEDLDDWLTNYYGALSAVAIPNQLSAYSRYMSENMPDKIRARDIEGSSFTEKTYNTFKEILKRKLPQDSDDIASRVNVWGQPVPATPEGVDPIIYNFIDPTKGRKVTYDDVTLAVYDLYKKTGKTEGIPQVPDRDLQVIKRRTGKKARFRLDPMLYEEYAASVGKANRRVAERLLGDKVFRRLDSEEQVKTLSNAYGKASQTARQDFVRRKQRSIEAGQEL